MKMYFGSVIFGIVIGMILGGCRVSKNNHISKRNKAIDTAGFIITPVLDTSTKAMRLPPAEDFLVHLDTIQKTQIKYKIFNAKIKIDFEQGETTHKFTAYLSMAKDSVIFARLAAPPFGIVIQIKVNKDSIFIVNNINKTIQKESINKLEQYLNVPLNFSLLQNLLIGNPFLLGATSQASTINNNNLHFEFIEDPFKEELIYDKATYQLVACILTDKTIPSKRKCTLSYDDYEWVSGAFFFPKHRVAQILTEGNLIHLDFDIKQYNFNPILEHSFVINPSVKSKK